MSSLWTPDGERPVNRTPPPAAGGVATPGGAPVDGDEAVGGDPLASAAAALGIDLESLSDSEREELRSELGEMMRVRREVGATPASEMVSNHLMRFLDLATIYLEAEPPAFAEAATAIEAFRAVVERIGDRLGEYEPMLTEALGQIQMIFVQVKNAHESAAPGS
jgi:hypothetical protein